MNDVLAKLGVWFISGVLLALLLGPLVWVLWDTTRGFQP